jgi:large subunit ribosomal protein L33
MRDMVTLACDKCKRRNYNTSRNRRRKPDRMQIKKYCRFCNSHTLHKETR